MEILIVLIIATILIVVGFSVMIKILNNNVDETHDELFGENSWLTQEEKDLFSDEEKKGLVNSWKNAINDSI